VQLRRDLEIDQRLCYLGCRWGIFVGEVLELGGVEEMSARLSGDADLSWSGVCLFAVDSEN
jgi:hypothetical protein